MKHILAYIFLLLIYPFNPSNTAVRYELPCLNQVITSSFELLKEQVGVLEKTGHNDGYKVELYLSSVGLHKGQPYCQAGQYWCFKTATENLNLDKKYIPIYKSGSTVQAFNRAAKTGKQTQLIPKKHDLLYWINKDGATGHVERIIEVKQAGWVVTIGFNTSGDHRGSQREGQGVYIKQRNILAPLTRCMFRGLIGFKGYNATP